MFGNYSQFPPYLSNNDTGYIDVEIHIANNNNSPTTGTPETGSVSDNEVPLLKQSPPVVALLTTAYGVVLLLAVVNNSLVVTAIHRNQQLRTVTNMFVANLAVADITVSLLVLPITLLANLFTEWQLGAFLCRVAPYLQALAVGASSNTLVAVAVERYFAIFHPGSMSFRPNQVILIICIIWMVPACVQIPWAVFSQQRDFDVSGTKMTYCFQTWTKDFAKGFFLGVVFLTCYLIPLLFLAVCYSLIGGRVWKRTVAGIRGSQAEKNINRSKIRIVRMLVVVTTTFALSWLPLYSIGLYLWFGPPLTHGQVLLIRDTLTPIAQWLGSANSCVNPFIYCYFSELFRNAIANIFRKGWCCQRFAQVEGSPRTQSTRVVVADGDTKSNLNHKKGSLIVTDNCNNGLDKQV